MAEPSKGDHVTWSSHGNDVPGTIEKQDPQYLVQSDKTGKQAVHKPTALHED